MLTSSRVPGPAAATVCRVSDSRRHNGPILLTALTLLAAVGAPGAQPLGEADFIRMAAQRDQALGALLHDGDGVLIASQDFGPGIDGCANQPLTVPRLGEATRERLRREMAPAGLADGSSQAQAQAQYDAAMAAHHAEAARQRQAREAWMAAFRQVKPAYDREWEAAHQAHRRAMAAARTPAERQQLEREWQRQWDELRARHYGPLGPQPVVPEPPTPPVGVRDERAPLALPTVRAALLRIGLGLHDPLVPGAGPGGEGHWRDAAELRAWLTHVLPRIDAACPQARQLVLAMGFYEVMARRDGNPGPTLPQQMHVVKVDGQWRPEVLYPPTVGTKLDLLRSARPPATGNAPSTGPVLYWLEEAGHDHAFGRFFEARPSAWATLPGIEWRDRAHWTRFENEGDRQLIERGVGGSDLRRFEAARVVFAGAFEVLPQIALWDTYVSLLEAFEKTCAAELARQDPVERSVTVTETDPRTGVSRSGTTRRTLPRRHLAAFEEANTRYNTAMMRGGLGAVLSGGVGSLIGAEQTRLNRRDQRVHAAQRFLQHEGCASPAAGQLLENFQRAVLRQPSLQQERAGARR